METMGTRGQIPQGSLSLYLCPVLPARLRYNLLEAASICPCPSTDLSLVTQPCTDSAIFIFPHYSLSGPKTYPKYIVTKELAH